MKIRASFVLLVLGTVVAAGGVAPSTAIAQSSDAAKPAASSSNEVLTDDILRALGIERDWMKDNDKLKSALTDAVTKFRAGDAQATLKALEEATKADNSLPPHELLFARLLILINDIQNGRRLLDQVAAKSRDCPEVYLLLGNLALGEGRMTDAYLEYTMSGELVGNNRSTVESRWDEARRKDFLREIYSGKAAVFEQLQNWEHAKAELIPWQTMNPEDPLVHLRLGRILYLEGVKPDGDDKAFDSNYKNALAEFKEAYRLQKEKGVYKNDPVIERPEIVLLQLHTLANKLDRARTEIKAIDGEEQAIRTQDAKEAGRIFTQISIWYLRQGEFDQARKYATKATELDKESPALKALSAMLSYYANDPKAEEDFAKMHAESPGDFFASNYLALILANSGDEAKKNRAVQLAEMNARLYQQSAEALSTLGWCYFNVGRYQEALKVMGAFTQGAQISPDTAYYFAKVLLATQRFASRDVFNLLESAVAAKGPFKHRREAEMWLKNLQGDTGDGNAKSTTPVTPAATNKESKDDNKETEKKATTNP